MKSTTYLVVGAAATDRVSQRPHQGENQTDDQHENADGPQDRNMEEKSDKEQNDSENNHGVQQLSA